MRKQRLVRLKLSRPDSDIYADPAAFYTVDEFDTAAETLKTFCLPRAESVRGQLEGTVPSTEEGQQADKLFPY